MIFNELNDAEIMEVDGGVDWDTVGKGFTVVCGTIGVVTGIAGAAAATAPVAAVAAPVVLIGVAGAAVGGAIMGKGFND